MTMLLPERRPGSGGGTNSVNYGELFERAQREVQPVPLGAYRDLATSIADGRKYALSHGMKMWEADTELRESFVYAQDDLRLARFAEAAIDLPRMAAMQGWHDRHPAEQLIGSDEAKSREIAYALCEYNHLMRDVILDARASVDRPGLVATLNDASDNRATKLLTRVVRGATAEIALFDTLRASPAYAGVEFTSVEDDFHGTDITAHHFGHQVGFDVKFEASRKEMVANRKVGRDYITHITIAVPESAIDGLHVTDAGRQALTRKLDDFMAMSS